MRRLTARTGASSFAEWVAGAVREAPVDREEPGFSIEFEAVMMRRAWKIRSGTTWCLAASLAIAGCGDGGGNGVEPDPDVAPFVGTWDAEVFTVTSDADPDIVADLMENGTFNINVQPSGAYTATLVFGGIPLVEIGTLSVSEGFITLRPNGGTPATSSYTFVSDDYLRLVGPTEFDFNLDDEPEPAEAHIELRRR